MLKSNRWAVLISFTLLAGISQMLWLNFAPLISLVESRYGVSEAAANWLTAVFPLIYVFLSIHSGIVIDRYGYRVGVGVGGLIMAIFACVRIFDSSYIVLLIGQIGIAIGQPYVTNGISKLVVDWFGAKQQAMATGIGILGMFAGMALALAGTPMLHDALGFQATMIVFAIIACLSALVFWLIAYPNPAGNQIEMNRNIDWRSFIPLLHNRQLLLLSAIAFLALGFFNGITSWLEPIVQPNGLEPDEAGLIGGALIMGGIIGASILPSLADRWGKGKLFLRISCVSAAILIYPLCTQGNMWVLLTLALGLGFLFLPGYALLLSMTEQSSGETHAGEATSLMMLAGNIGGVIVILAMEFVKGSSTTWIDAVYLLIVLMLLSFALTFGLKQYSLPSQFDR